MKGAHKWGKSQYTTIVQCSHCGLCRYRLNKAMKDQIGKKFLYSYTFRTRNIQGSDWKREFIDCLTTEERLIKEVIC